MATFTATTKSAETPQNVEAGMYDLRFTGTEARRIKGGQYTKDTVNGDPKLQWNFVVVDDDGNDLPFIGADGEEVFSDGDPVEVRVDKLTGVGFNIASKTVPGEVLMLKALLTPAEYKAFEAGEGTDESALLGRIVQGELFINSGGFLGVGAVIKARTKRSAK